MINKSDIGKFLEVVSAGDYLIYMLEFQGSWQLPDGTDFKLLVYNTLGVQVEPSISTVLPSTLFFDSDKNYYMLNANGKIAQYNFETKELDPPLSDETWDMNILSMTDYNNDDIIVAKNLTSFSPGDPLVIQRYRIGDSSTVRATSNIDINPNIVAQVAGAVSMSREGDNTAITLLEYYSFTFHPITVIGTGTYNSQGMLTDIDIQHSYSNESGATITNGKLYTSTSQVIRVRDIATNEIINEYPITGQASGSIGFELVESEGSFDGTLKSISVEKTVATIIPNSSGQPVLFTVPGRKTLTMNLISSEIDGYLNADIDTVEVKVKGTTGDVEEYEIKSIEAGEIRQEDGSVTPTDFFEVALHTPVAPI
jgi:hypothetical protein